MDRISQLSERTKSLIAVVTGAAIYALLGLLLTSPERTIRLIAVTLLGWVALPVSLIYEPTESPSLLLAVIGALVGRGVYGLWHSEAWLRPTIVGLCVVNSLSVLAVLSSIDLQYLD